MPADTPPARDDRVAITPPVLFALHALGSSGQEFDAVAAELGAAVRVVAIDLPGFGSEPVTAGTTVSQMADHVLEIIRRTGAPRWMLVGHSMGGKIASVVAARCEAGQARTFGLAGVVLLAASPVSPEPMEESRRSLMLSWVDDGPLDLDAAREFVSANVGAPLPEAQDEAAIAELLRSDPQAWRDWLERGSREDHSAEIGELTVPALIVSGGDDGDLGEAAQHALNGTTYPHARFVTLEGAGHLLPRERPREVAGLIEDFWTSYAGRAPDIPSDVAATLASDHTSARTRGIHTRRSFADDPLYAPQALSAEQLETLRSIAAVVVPQTGAPLDLAARVDAQLASGTGDGWRHTSLPPDVQAYRQSLDALHDFGSLDAADRRSVIDELIAGEYDSAVPSDQLQAWFDDARVDLVRIWLAHPASMARVGYDGFANGGDGAQKQGFTLLAAGTREAWEPDLPQPDGKDRT